MRPAVLMFDLDGTLVDSMDDISASANLTRAHFGMPPLPRQEIVAKVGDGSAVLVRAVIPVPPDRHPEALAVFLRFYDAHLVDMTCLMPGVSAVLQRYGDRALAVVTNKLQEQSERILAHLGVRPSFRMVIGGDTLPTRKPDPGPLLHVLAACGAKPTEAVMIGDGVNDVIAAKAAGVPVIAVNGGVTSRSELAALQPDHLIDSLEHLAGVLD